MPRRPQADSRLRFATRGKRVEFDDSLPHRQARWGMLIDREDPQQLPPRFTGWAAIEADRRLRTYPPLPCLMEVCAVGSGKSGNFCPGES
jgi:hypothetical protein